MNNPYSTFPANEGIVEQRTSILAIVALVLSLLCFIPGLSIVAIIVAIIALVMIGGSNQRLSGRGLAIAGLIIGLLVTVAYIGAYLAVRGAFGMMEKAVAGPTRSMFEAIEAGDYAKARAQLDPRTQAAVTDEDIKRFADAYKAEMGSFQEIPTGLFKLIEAYSQLGPIMQNFQNNKGDVIPLPGRFDNGWAVLALQIDQNQQGSKGQIQLQPLNIKIMTVKGSEFLIYDPQAGQTAPPGATPATPAVPDTGTTKIEPIPGVKIEIDKGTKP